MTVGADFILVVEKETIFNSLLEMRFVHMFNCVLLTGKGYPDDATKGKYIHTHAYMQTYYYYYHYYYYYQRILCQKNLKEPHYYHSSYYSYFYYYDDDATNKQTSKQANTYMCKHIYILILYFA